MALQYCGPWLSKVSWPDASAFKCRLRLQRKPQDSTMLGKETRQSRQSYIAAQEDLVPLRCGKGARKRKKPSWKPLCSWFSALCITRHRMAGYCKATRKFIIMKFDASTPLNIQEVKCLYRHLLLCLRQFFHVKTHRPFVLLCHRRT